MPPKRKHVEEDLYYGQQEIKGTKQTQKRRKDEKQTIEAPEEKRQARFRASCPKAITERVDRVRAQRFYMIERERQPNVLREQFKVLGSTGNVYTITIDNVPSCDCPDFLKGNHCKHLIFVFLKILGVKESSHFYYQKALLTSELATIFADAPPAPTAVVNHKLVSAYAEATGKSIPSGSNQPSSSEVTAKRDVDGSDCAVCYEEMKAKTQGDLSKLVFCDTCHNGLHSDCFRMWSTSKNPVTCVYCRAPWPLGETSQFDDIAPQEGYLNLGKIAGISGRRDTSSYYHGSSWTKRRGGGYY